MLASTPCFKRSRGCSPRPWSWPPCRPQGHHLLVRLHYRLSLLVVRLVARAVGLAARSPPRLAASAAAHFEVSEMLSILCAGQEVVADQRTANARGVGEPARTAHIPLFDVDALFSQAQGSAARCLTLENGALVERPACPFRLATFQKHATYADAINEVQSLKSQPKGMLGKPGYHFHLLRLGGWRVHRRDRTRDPR